MRDAYRGEGSKTLTIRFPPPGDAGSSDCEQEPCSPRRTLTQTPPGLKPTVSKPLLHAGATF